MNRIGLILAIGLGLSGATNAADSAVFYHDDFEGGNNMRFRACAVPWTSSLKQAQREGYLKLNRATITEQSEGKSHGGVRSFALDMIIDKSTGKWGAHNMWTTKTPMHIPLDKPVFFSAFVYPEELPPDLRIRMSVIFNGVGKKGNKLIGGFYSFDPIGVDAQGWMVFQTDLTQFLKSKCIEQPIMTGWQLVVMGAPQKAFHGQRVKLFLDDVTIGTEKENISVDKSGIVRHTDILKGGPHTVRYTSLYRGFPDNAVNQVKNSSFELGLDSWFTSVSLPGSALLPGNPKLPDPSRTFRIVDNDVIHGNKALEISRNDGISNSCCLISMPVRIKDGKPYTLSLYAQASAPTQLVVANQKLDISTKWKRYNIAIPKIICETRGAKKLSGRYIIRVSHTGSEKLRLDAVQLQEGILSDYQIPECVTIAARPGNYDGLYLPKEKPEFKVSLFNGTNETRNVNVTSRIQDFMHRQIA